MKRRNRGAQIVVTQGAMVVNGKEYHRKQSLYPSYRKILCLSMCLVVFYLYWWTVVNPLLIVPRFVQEEEESTSTNSTRTIRTTTAATPHHDDNDKNPANIFITVKTTHRNHLKRIPSILDTWYKFVAPQDVAFLTDAPIQRGSRSPTTFAQSVQWHDTECPSTHSSKGLCCKTAAEIDYFHHIQTNNNKNYKWMCHVDDDVFVHYPNLQQYLLALEQQKDGMEEYFLGYGNRQIQVNKGGIQARLRRPPNETSHMVVHTIDYATGGAWCLSAPLVQRGIDQFRNLTETCQEIVYSDDISLSYMVQVVLGVAMTQERRFYSHLDPQKFVSKETAQRQITFGSGYKSVGGRQKFNFVQYPGFQIPVDERTGRPTNKDDPMGFRALYCSFWPKECNTNQMQGVHDGSTTRAR